MSRLACRWAAALTATSLASACANDPPTLVIGFASNMGSPSAADVAQAALSESHQPGTPTIVVLASAPAPPPVAGRLLGEVDRALRYAKDPAVIALVGPGGSREALQTSPVFRDAGMANVIPTATSRLLQDLGPLSFLLAPNDSVQGEFIGRFVAERLHAKTAALMYVPDEYGVGLATGSAVALGHRGVKITARLPVRPNELCQPRAPRNSYDDVVTDVLAYGVTDVIVLAARTPESACIARAVRERAPATRFVAGDGVLIQHAFLELVGTAVDSIYFVAFWHRDRPDSASRAFVERFRAIVKREPRHDDAMFYDAVMLIGQAIRDGATSRAAVAEYFSELGRERPPYRGITGPIAFTPGAPRPLLMMRFRGGQLEPVPVR